MNASIHCNSTPVEVTLQHFEKTHYSNGFYTLKIKFREDEFTIYADNLSVFTPITNALNIPSLPTVTKIGVTEGDSTPDQPETQNYN